ncbi:isocitrate lyase/phosphoenolpyruvate mutase family protein [Muribacter muris]|uniref:Isocitrate lyase/phosphoenolpyruvate mutase family protein n=1 Tax=Muribacter muris TaxID=67855 RepID=A0A4Y9JR43_9PAST|nr:isocitrate lyase/phosphoenolpyruvate mutase family protein [Muribacter muris]MBF0786032.1 isocitrate lyase/phosphoenolpyruvate mutase family protein [Muribacter muris]MBF0826790.1 isocitrate lyase/phosphoenolpyruvate mutase family protein [Muribacter muris]TFV08161.1 isocitrate lyase/phosphoenolpyruvate mutase family protein [Muribacter muris]
MKHLIKENDCLIIGNVWDSLSAIVHEQAGFKALGTTSWGICNTFGYQDGQKISFDDLKGVVAQILKVINIPLSVDVEKGYANNHKDIVKNILTLAKMGCSGVNLEDSLISGEGLQDIDNFCKLVKEIKKELLENGFDDFYLNIRTDTYLILKNPLDETIKRSIAYQNAGADGIFVPCLQQVNDIKAILNNITIPLNVMSLPNLTDIEELRKLGIQRFSYGNAMSDHIITEIEKATKTIIAHRCTSHLYDHPQLETNFKS